MHPHKLIPSGAHRRGRHVFVCVFVCFFSLTSPSLFLFILSLSQPLHRCLPTSLSLSFSHSLSRSLSAFSRPDTFHRAHVAEHTHSSLSLSPVRPLSLALALSTTLSPSLSPPRSPSLLHSRACPNPSALPLKHKTCASFLFKVHHAVLLENYCRNGAVVQKNENTYFDDLSKK